MITMKTKNKTHQRSKRHSLASKKKASHAHAAATVRLVLGDCSAHKLQEIAEQATHQQLPAIDLAINEAQLGYKHAAVLLKSCRSQHHSPVRFTCDEPLKAAAFLVAARTIMNAFHWAYEMQPNLSNNERLLLKLLLLHRLSNKEAAARLGLSSDKLPALWSAVMTKVLDYVRHRLQHDPCEYLLRDLLSDGEMLEGTDMDSFCARLENLLQNVASMSNPQLRRAARLAFAA